MKKYIAFRVERGVYNPKTFTINHNLYCVRGQRGTDLNWERIGGAYETEAEAHDFAAHAKSISGTGYRGGNFCPVYNPNGYGYSDI